MAKITVFKQYGNRETLRLYELEEVVALIRDGGYRQQTDNLRNIYPALNLERQPDGTVRGASALTGKLARICFASELENRNHQQVNRGYTGLVLLEVNNLTSYDEADAIRQGAGEVPQTLMAFVGASGRSVKIVCRGELFPSEAGQLGKAADSPTPLPQDEQAAKDFHENLYERARLAYSTQLGVTVEKLQPSLLRTCYVSADSEAVYNPMALPIYARAEKPTQNLSLVRPTTVEPEEITPGSSRFFTLHHIFEFNLEKAYDDCEGTDYNDPNYRHMLLSRLAQHCLETGIPMAVARSMVRYRVYGIGDDEQLADLVFKNTYRPSVVKRYEERKGYRPEKNVPAETLLTMKIDLFLNENYEIRKNIMRGVAEFRERRGIGFSFRDLTEEARNSITMRAMLQGIKCWDKDIRRYVNSEDIEMYDPLNEYLDSLPRWDGRDRVTALARRVPTEYEAWPAMFRLWMRSMVAMWLGKGQLAGNALVPLLIGRQGCGKSSFCRLLLPYELRDYYNDRINFKNETDLNLGLTSFGLINLDEFDSVTQRQQVVLKYLVSTADLKYRPPYGKAYSQHRRFASFVGTTNEMRPLTDPSGSRRFVCVPVSGDIDFHSPVEYRQLYAQLLHEIQNGERYWPDREEERLLMEHNQDFQQISGLGEMLLSVIERPDGEHDGQWMSLKQISALLKQNFKGYTEEDKSFQKIGSYLNRPECQFKSKHQKTGNAYWVKVRE